jgi:hypothetical protein
MGSLNPKSAVGRISYYKSSPAVTFQCIQSVFLSSQQMLDTVSTTVPKESVPGHINLVDVDMMDRRTRKQGVSQPIIISPPTLQLTPNLGGGGGGMARRLDGVRQFIYLVGGARVRPKKADMQDILFAVAGRNIKGR